MSSWVIKCMGCGKTRTGDEPGCPHCNAKAHAERLQAAEKRTGEAMQRASLYTGGWDEAEAIAELIDAKVTLALLERGGG